MDIAAIRNSPTLDLFALKAKVIALDVKDALTPRRLDRAAAEREWEYATLYRRLQQTAKSLGDHYGALEYSKHKRAHVREALRIMDSKYLD